MREINEEFALKILEKEIGRPAEEIKQEGTYESEIWPGGDGEYSACITGTIRTAKAVIDYYKGKRPPKVTLDDLNNIIQSRDGQLRRPYEEKDLERWVGEINLIFDVYENE